MKQLKVSYMTHLQGVCLEVVGEYINSNEDFDVQKAILILNELVIQIRIWLKGYKKR